MSRHFSANTFAITVVLVVCVMAVTAPAQGQTVHVSDDTNTNITTPNQINGTATTLFVRNIGAGGVRHTFLRFDVSTLPSGVPVNKAMLRLFVSAVNDPGPVDVYQVLGAWNEETLSNLVAPQLGAVIGTVNFAASDQNHFVLANITSVVQGWLDGSITNFGIALVPVAADPVRVTLDSKETTLTSHGPELEVALVPAADITGVTAGIGLSGGGASGDVTLSLNTAFSDARYAAAAHGHDVSQITNAASLGANTFTGTQTIDSGNLDLDPSTATTGNITKNGARFLHNFGSDNTFLGLSAGNVSMTGSSNTASGVAALQANSAGSSNTASGVTSLQSNTIGVFNTADGARALNLNTIGDRNTASGEGALFANTTGSNSVALGSRAGFNATTGSNNIYLGTNVVGVAGESNTMYLGLQGTQTKTVIAGVRGTTVTGGEAVLIDAAGRLGSGAVAPGANTVGSAQVIDDSLTANDLAPNSVTGSELATASVTGDKVAFNYAGSTSAGGAATDVACVGCVAASEVSFSFATLGANTFTATQTIDTGNLDLDASTATTGNLTKNGTRFLHNFGTNNTFLGVSAGNFTMAGFGGNTAVGFQALSSNTTGGPNTAVGFSALAANTNGTGNTAVGFSALTSNTVGEENTAVGLRALDSTTVGIMNTAVGSQALRFNTTGNHNTALGRGALSNNLGSFNTAFGSSANAANTAGQRNTAVGQSALFSNTTGSDNVAVGLNAGINATIGGNNIYLGANVQGVAGESDTMYLGGTQTTTVIAGVRGTTVTGGEPVVIDAAGRLGSGVVAPGANTVGSAQVIDDSLTASDLAPNSVTGSELGAASVTADKVAFNYAGSTSAGGAATDVACVGCVAASEVSFSFATLGANTFTATQTIDTGNLDLDDSTATAGNITKNGQPFLRNPGTNNTFLGLNAGNFSLTTFHNTAIGTQALTNNTTGQSNTATGSLALTSNTSGSGNTATGLFALRNNTVGSANTAVGYLALGNNIGGVNNTAIGIGALQLNTSGLSNTAGGTSSLINNTTGDENTASGAHALTDNTTGINNTAIGSSALVDNSIGSDNVAIGRGAGLFATTGSNNIYLGANVLGVAGEANIMYLGKQGTQTKTIVAGIRGTTTVNPDAIPVMIDSAGQLGTVSSSRRFKEDIRDMADTSRRLFQLRPVTFRYKQAYGDGSKPVQYGLIAEEVAEAFPELAVRDANGDVETVHYETLNALLLNELQKQQKDVRRQEDELRQQRQHLQRQRERIEALEQRLNELLGPREAQAVTRRR